MAIMSAHLFVVVVGNFLMHTQLSASHLVGFGSVSIGTTQWYR